MKRPAHPSTLILTDRDQAILELVFAYGGCSVEHIRRRFFPSAGSRSACYTRVSKLIKAQYLTATRLPSQSGIGSGPLLLSLGPQGRPFIARLRSCSVSELGRSSRVSSPLLINHSLAICDVRLSLELAVTTSEVFTACEWTPEWELRRIPLKVKDAASETVIPLIADGSVTLTAEGGSEQAFLVEIDRANGAERLKRIRPKLRGYLLRNATDRCPILWVTESAGRARHISAWVLAEAKKLQADPTIFWLTTLAAITEQSILAEPIWSVVGGPASLSLNAAAGTAGPGVAAPRPARQLLLAAGGDV